MLEKSNSFEIVIVGAGFSGLGMAIRLKKKRVSDFVILERGDSVGGVWRDNSYPGCACDIESHLYSFSFALNPDWSHQFAGREEIWRYLQACADRFGITPHIRFKHTLQSARWDTKENRWKVTTSHGEITARILITATGALNHPLIPELPGLSEFSGVKFHSSTWDHQSDLKDKRVAVIGTGASAIQFIPQIQRQASRLIVFQRTPAWVLPRRDHPLPDKRKARYRHFRPLLWLTRLRLYLFHEGFGIAFRNPEKMATARHVALRHMKKAISDPGLREKLTPNYQIGCKRILISDDYYPAMAQPNVELLTDAIRHIGANSITLADGTKRDVDVIIFGTGFRVTDFAFAKLIFGADGRSLMEIWGNTARAYAGTMSPGFPNLFYLLGPNTGLGHNSVLLMLEAQIDLVLKAVHHIRRKGLVLDVKPEAEQRFVELVDRKSRETVWLTGCKSWYLDKTGRNSTLWPMSVGKFRRVVSRFRRSDYHFNRPL